MLKAVWYLFCMECTLLWRRSHDWLYPLGFYVMVISLFPLAFTPAPAFLQQYVPGCIWIAALLASLLSLEQVFFTDLEDGCLEQLLLSQIPLTMIMLLKFMARWLVAELPLVLLTPILGLMFHLAPSVILMLSVSLLLGTPVFTLIGGLGAALILGLRQQGVLLGLIILPLVTPVLIVGVTIVQQFQAGLSVAGPLALLGGLSLFAVTLLPWAIAATVRVSVAG